MNRFGGVRAEKGFRDREVATCSRKETTMFCSLKYLAVAMGFWGMVLSVLAFIYSQEQAEFRLLSDREMCLVAKGAGQVPACSTNQLISSVCTDRYATCPSLGEANCKENPSCTGCDGGNPSTSICDQVTKPWVFLCNVQSNPGACGNYYLNPTCQWSNGACYCTSAFIMQNSPCSQPTNTLSGGCTQTN